MNYTHQPSLITSPSSFFILPHNSSLLPHPSRHITNHNSQIVYTQQPFVIHNSHLLLHPSLAFPYYHNRSTYIGENFGLRHTMTVTVKRPWYASSPEHSIPISLYRIISPMVPGSDGTAAPCIYDYQEENHDVENNNKGNEENHDEEEDDLGVNWRPLILSLSNFHGVCRLTLPTRWVNLDTPLLGKITFFDFTEAVVSCHLLLIRAEHVQGEVKEKTLLIHQVNNPTPTPPHPTPPAIKMGCDK